MSRIPEASDDSGDWTRKLSEVHEAILRTGQTTPPPSSVTTVDGAGSPADDRLSRATRCLWSLERHRRKTTSAAGPGPSDIAAVDLSPSTTFIGPYRLIDVIGEGAHGVVYRATDGRLDREVALKIPRPSVVLSPKLRKRFDHESQIAASLDHANVVPVFEASEFDGTPVIASALVSGPTLQSFLDAEPTPTVGATVRCVRQISAGVAHAHSRGVLHRDLKPANVLLAPRETTIDGGPDASLDGYRPMVADFGLASFERLPGETADGTVLGTPDYMAPEQAAGDVAASGTAVDIYALGGILYRMLTGDLRTPDLSASPRRRVLTIPPDLDAICQKALADRPDDRYPTAESLASDLTAFLHGRPVTARPVSTASHVRRWMSRNRLATTLIAAVGGLTLVAVIGSLTAAVVFQRQRDALDHALTRANEAESELRSTVDQLRSELYRQSTAARVESLSRVIDHQPRSVSSLYQRGTEHWRGEDYPSASEDFLAVLRLDPDHPHALADLAWIRLIGPEAVRDDVEALALTTRAAAVAGDNWSIAATHALALFRNRHHDRAVRAADRVTDLRRRDGREPNAAHRFVSAMALWRAGETDRAAAEYDAGLSRLDATRWELPLSEIRQLAAEAAGVLGREPPDI